MKKFILLISYCLFLTTALLISIKITLSNKGRIVENQNILLGDSHVEFISVKNLTNFSTSGAYMKTLFKGIQNLDVQNKNVYISVGPHTFADFRTSRYNSKHENKGLLYTMDTLIPKRLNIYHSWWKLPNSGKELYRISKLYTSTIK